MICFLYKSVHLVFVNQAKTTALVFVNQAKKTALVFVNQAKKTALVFVNQAKKTVLVFVNQAKKMPWIYRVTPSKSETNRSDSWVMDRRTQTNRDYFCIKKLFLGT